MKENNMPSAQALKERGNYYWQRSQYRDAISAWSDAIDSRTVTEDMLPSLYSNRSAAFLKTGDLGRALGDAEACVAMRPEWARGHARRGAALSRFPHRLTEAAAAYQQAAELDPSSQEYRSAASDARHRAARGERHTQASPSPGTAYGQPAAGRNYVAEALVWFSQNQAMIFQVGLFLLALWILFGGALSSSSFGGGYGGSGGYGGIGGFDWSWVLVAGVGYLAYRSGMSPFQIMMLLNMLSGRRGHGRRGWGGYPPRGFGGGGGGMFGRRGGYW
uniref:Uncharacterized protein n=1 Tax=Rhizochromulina marina TaxID=1034831 RepID=A0A7S2SWU3_9STRA|mmetsp:Transcript_9767/g.27625  ORF Transcript_9767/g.27625 Transcript_9767/m.27625 type:complete len:275 (+) Transcript_9767:53-877(+)